MSRSDPVGAQLSTYAFPEELRVDELLVRRTVQAAVEHAFANGIYRVEAHVRMGNLASERVLERADFRSEGVKVRFLRRGDAERHDATLFARLADD
jgi:RimJ/RimL family protein N-acetyltransferase